MLRPSREENPHMHTSVCGINHDVKAFEFAAVFLFALFLAKPYQLGGGKALSLGLIFCASGFPYLYHAEPVGLTPFVCEEFDNGLAGEPAVSEDITKLDALFGGPFHHFLGKFCLGGVVCFLSLVKHIAGFLAHMTCGNSLALMP